MENSAVPALAASFLALSFTIVSFWWLNVRRGRLVASPPQQYGSVIQDSTLTLRLPIVLYNTGAQTIFVQMFRLRFVDVPRPYLQWVATCDEMLTPVRVIRRVICS